MGEAKRRKKLLGKDYGKKESIVIVGSAEFKRHLQKFADAWTEKLKEMDDSLEEEEVNTKQEQFNQWMQNYLDSYRQSERERIVMGVLNQVYAEIAEMRPSPHKGIEWTLNWSIETLFLYQMFKPYLSTSSAKSYAQPLLGVYETVIREAIENLKDKIESQAKMEKLKQHFEEILEIEASKRY